MPGDPTPAPGSPAPETPTPQPAANRWQGKRLGKFRLLSLLGRGAMAKVFLAEDTTLKRQVALKVLPVDEADEAQKAKARLFIREARAAARLVHPHIVNVLEIDRTNGIVFIAMDLAEGGDAKTLIQTAGALPPGRACGLAADAAEALAFAHRAGVVHRDVKPGNLMLTRAGRGKLVDFGLADAGDPNDPHRLPDGVIGTPAYMAPEVARGETATAASDQYSLGATLFHLLTGQPLFRGPNIRAVLQQQVRDEPPELDALSPGLPPALVDLVDTALAKDPADRHPGLDDVARQLRAFAVALGPGVSASSGSLVAGVPAAPKPRRPVGGVAWMAAGAGVLALGIGAGVVVLGPGDPPAPKPPTPHADAEPQSGEASGTATQTRPPAPTLEAPATLTPADTEALLDLAVAEGEAVVVGTVGRAHLSGSGKTFMLKFDGHQRDHLQAVWRPEHFDAMADAFGGTHGETLEGRTVRVTGPVTRFFGNPQIVVTDPAQVQILDD
ncbi:MAG: protein kinase [Planctomycetota bacterium]